jgi:hypothetical protein
MASLVLTGDTSGQVTIAAPAVAGTTTLTLPATTGTVIASDASANIQFNSGYGSVATAYGCRAWVNFNGTGTVAIRASGNVTSITDNGTGDYTVNFTTAMPDANYAVTGMCGQGANAMIIHRPTGTALTTSAARVTGASTANALTDMTEVHIAIFR